MSFPIEVHLPTDETIQIDTLDQLDDLILDHFARSNRYAPDALAIENVHGCNLTLGLAHESFVHVRKDPAALNMITIGDATRMGSQTFFLGQKYPIHVEIRHLVPFPIVRRIVNKFIEDGELSDEVQWEGD
jgi:hypothetical protein